MQNYICRISDYEEEAESQKLSRYTYEEEFYK